MQQLNMKVVFEVEIPHLGEKIKQARVSDGRSVYVLAPLAEMTPANWYRLESEDSKSIPYKTLRRIESVLSTDFGISFGEA